MAETLPRHIGVIMDGNGRWAKKRGLPRKIGHVNGAKAIKDIVRYCNKIGIEYLTIYAFSTENWKRPKDEVSSLMKLLRHYLNEVDLYVEDNIKVRFIGDLSTFEQDIQEQIQETIIKCEKNTGMTFCIAINYGGRDEIKNAMKKIAVQIEDGVLSSSEISENLIEKNLYTSGMPNVDLVIRPSGEYRLSNFLTWQSAYAELIFMDDILWPDFKPKHLEAALQEFSKRNRRFGGV